MNVQELYEYDPEERRREREIERTENASPFHRRRHQATVDSSWINDAADAIAERFMCTLGERNEIAAFIEAEYLKCPLCKGEAGKVQVDETGDDRWHSCENCHGSGNRIGEF